MGTSLVRWLIVAALCAVLASGWVSCFGKRGDENALVGEQEINGVEYREFTVNTLAQAAKKAPYLNELIDYSISDPKTFNPHTANETSSLDAYAWVFEGLTNSDGVTLEVIPWLAERWEVAEDQVTWTFYLRRDVTFHDGTPMTADDVVFSFNDIVLNDDVPGVGMRDLLTVDGEKVRCEKVDDYTVRFITPAPYAPFERFIGGVPIVPKHLLEDVVRKGEYASHWNVGTDLKSIVGTGPFRIVLYKNGERLVQERWTGYWNRGLFKENEQPIARRQLLITPNINTALLKFKNGDVDGYSVRGEDYASMKTIASEQNFSIYDAGTTSGTFFLVFNQSVVSGEDRGIPKRMQRWFRDLEFRRAVAHAIDKKTIINNVHLGFAEPLWSPVPASNPFYHKADVKTYPYDLDKACTILERAGYKDFDGDGFREMPRGTRVKFVLTTNSGNEVREKMCQIIAEDLKNIGLDVTSQPLDFNNLVNKLQYTYDWQAMVLGLTGGIEPCGGRNVWNTDGRTHMWNQMPLKALKESQKEEWETSVAQWQEGLRPWEYEIEALMNQAVRTLDREARREIYLEWQDVVAENLPFIYLTSPRSLTALRNKFVNQKPTAYGGTFHNLETELMIMQ